MSANDYQNYFKNQALIEPSYIERFYPFQVKQILQRNLESELENFVLDESNVQEKTNQLTLQI